MSVKYEWHLIVCFSFFCFVLFFFCVFSFCFRLKYKKWIHTHKHSQVYECPEVIVNGEMHEIQRLFWLKHVLCILKLIQYISFDVAFPFMSWYLNIENKRYSILTTDSFGSVCNVYWLNRLFMVSSLNPTLVHSFFVLLVIRTYHFYFRIKRHPTFNTFKAIQVGQSPWDECLIENSWMV